MSRRVAVASAIAALAVACAPTASPAASAAAKRGKPASWVKAQKDARALFAALRRPGKARDRLPGKASQRPPAAASRLLGSVAGKRFFLVLRGANACLAMVFSTGRPAGEKCVPVARIKARKQLPEMLGVANASAFFVVLVVPDGASVARMVDGVATPQPATGNAVMIASTPLGGTIDVTFRNGTVLQLPFGVSPSGLPTS